MGEGKSSSKQARAEKILKEELAKIIYKEMDVGLGVLVTLTKMKISPDMRNAKAWISVLPETLSNETIKKLSKQMPFFQYLLVKRMGMKWIPEIKLVEDTLEQEAAKIEDLIEKNKI